MELKRHLGLPTATLIVVASMIGTGIFITTGRVLEMTLSSPIVLILWAVGGLIALTGTLCYAELATMWPHVGGEYIYLKKSFGFLPSFLTGWISLVVGFSASIAISAISFIHYIDKFWRDVTYSQMGQTSYVFSFGITQKILASVIVLIFGAIHIHGVKSGSRIQNVLTVIKLMVVLSLIGFGLYVADWSNSGRLFQTYTNGTNHSINMPVISLSLLIIMFSYSGWNGATYIAGEIKDVEKHLPRALLLGTLLTTILYIGLNIVFMLSSPGLELMGKEAIGFIAARNLFGIELSSLFTLGISLILLSSISVQMMIGPRVYYAMARDKMIFKALSRVNPRFETPTVAIVIQMILTVFYIFIGNAPFLMKYLGFALGIFPVLTVIGLIYMRYKHPEINRPYKVPFFPFTPLIFIILSVTMMASGFFGELNEEGIPTSIIAILVLMVGVLVFFIWRKVAYNRIAN